MTFEILIVDFLTFLREENFLISENITADIFTAIIDSNVEITDEEQIMNIIRSFVCKTPEQFLCFPELFHSYFMSKKKANDKAIKRKKKIQQTEDKINILRKEAENKKNTPVKKDKLTGEFFGNEKERTAFLKKVEKQKKKIENLLKSEKLSKEHNNIANLLFLDKECEKYKNNLLEQILFDLQNMIKKQAFKTALSGDKNMIDILKKAMDMIKNAEEKLNNENTKTKGKKSEEELIQAEINKLLNELEKLKEENIEKEEAINHREIFENAHNSVKTKKGGSINLDKYISTVNATDAKLLQHYIAKNAKRFKTKIARNIRTESKLRFDMKNIVKKACATNGIPLQLIYKKPMQNKPKLVLILDVSGSCSSASRLMLMFMYYLKQVFTGGCDAYAFVDSLYNITEFLNSSSPEKAIDSVLKTIPTKGVYSNYYTPLKTFYEKRIHTITKDSIVIFIGDARNNKNDSGEEYLKAINRKARACFWLNPEMEEDWNVNDSIIDVYSKYMQETLPIITVRQLIDFVTNFKIKR